MFGSIGVPELIMIFVIALLLFGPRKLPEIGRSLGRALGEFRRASNDLKRTLEEEVATDQLREVQREVRAATQPESAAAPAIATPDTAHPADAPGQDAGRAPTASTPAANEPTEPR